MKIKYVSAALAVAFLLPFVASALTAEDIQAQITRLLAQITQLQEQLKQIQPEPVNMMPLRTCPDGTLVATYLPCPTSQSRVCPVFNRTLAQGATGDDVTQLQQYLGVSPTGYFGPMTARAVTAVQADAGISQVGIVGPATRAWFYRRCGGGGWNQNFTASPTSGAAPLNVTFKWIPGGVSAGDQYSVEFGDGQTGTFSAGYPCGDNLCSSHTYSNNGTYTAKLIYQPSFSCPPGAMCPQMMPMPQTVGTVTIYVGGSTSVASINVSSPTSGQNVSQGGTLSVSWNSQNAPAGSAVGLWLVRSGNTGCTNCQISPDTNLGLIAANQSTSGTFAWNVPLQPSPLPTTTCEAGSSAFDCIKQYNVGMPYGCPLDTPYVCASTVTAGTYEIVAKLYTPADACLGGLCWPNSTPKYLASSQSGAFTIGGSTIENTTFTASPTSGSAPLAVQFTTSQKFGTIDFGDGTTGQVQAGPLGLCGSGGCWGGGYGASHTYTSSGTYTAKLTTQGPSICSSNGICTADIVTKVLGTVTITVTGGSYGGGAPSISGLDAPTSLSVGQTGTWTVRLNTTNMGNLSYSVVWGDEGWGMTPGNAQSAFAPSIAASGSFTHAYQSAGTYSPKFTVSNSSGSAQTSASVTVGGSSSGQIITRRVGEQEGSFLIQKINQNSVEGLWYWQYPIPTNEGSPKTLYIGDDIGYACEGVSEKLTNIDYYGQTVTFLKVVGQQPLGGCPICLASNSTISTPVGEMNVKDVTVGMAVWSLDKQGNKIKSIVTKVSHTPVPATHHVVHLVLKDGRQVWVSAGHPAINGLPVSQLRAGETYDGSQIQSADSVQYWDTATYDILPDSDTGFYWANGILLGSTLK